jgi:hypothetical protein
MRFMPGRASRRSPGYEPRPYSRIFDRRPMHTQFCMSEEAGFEPSVPLSKVRVCGGGVTKIEPATLTPSGHRGHAHGELRS